MTPLPRHLSADRPAPVDASAPVFEERKPLECHIARQPRTDPPVGLCGHVPGEIWAFTPATPTCAVCTDLYRMGER